MTLRQVISWECLRILSRERIGLQRSIREPQLLDFETNKISGHADPDAYLTKIYGDYEAA